MSQVCAVYSPFPGSVSAIGILSAGFANCPLSARFWRLWELSFDARMWARQRTPAPPSAGVQPLYIVAGVYVPMQSKEVDWSGLAFALQVPFALPPFIFPPPSMRDHLLVPDSNAPSFMVPENSYL